MAYVAYDPQRQSPTSSTGWDAWAGDYAELGTRNVVYALGKQLLHALVDQVAPPPVGREAWVLDFNCGAGDDIARFLARGWRVTGCDGSPGMLQAAAARCGPALRDGRLELFLGRAEEIRPTSFGWRRFDLIFSTIGGFAYLDDAQFVEAHRDLVGMLTPGGALVLAHLTPFCLAESVYHLAHLSPRRAWNRWRGELDIEVHGQPLRMRLRSASRVRRLLAETVRVERLAPLLALTPPFQSGFRPSQRTLAMLAAAERAAAGIAPLAHVADQVVCVARRL